MENPFRYRGLFIVTKRLSFVLCQFFPGLIKSSKLFADLGFFFTQFDTFSNIGCHSGEAIRASISASRSSRAEI